MAILDAPPDRKPDEVLDWVLNSNLDSKFATMYWPWIEVLDPITKRPIQVPPCGHVAGIWCRTDSTRGVHKAPANEVVLGANDLGYTLTGSEQDSLNRAGINCIRAFPGRGIRVWGARTLSSDPEWRYINVRRLFNFVSESIMQGTQWAVFEPNDAGLVALAQDLRLELPDSDLAEWGPVRSNARAGLLCQMRRRDQPAGHGRGGTGHGRSRYRAGQAGRVRRLPYQAVPGAGWG